MVKLIVCLTLFLVLIIFLCFSEMMNRELALRQKEYLARLSELEHEMEIRKQQARLDRLRRDLQRVSPPPPPPRPPEAEMPMLMQPQMSPVDADPLYPAPYDPK